MHFTKVLVLLWFEDRWADHRMVLLRCNSSCYGFWHSRLGWRLCSKPKRRFVPEQQLFDCSFGMGRTDFFCQLHLDSRRKIGKFIFTSFVSVFLKLFFFQRNALYIKIAFGFFVVHLIFAITSIAVTQNYVMIVNIVILPYILWTLYSLNDKFMSDQPSLIHNSKHRRMPNTPWRNFSFYLHCKNFFQMFKFFNCYDFINSFSKI